MDKFSFKIRTCSNFTSAENYRGSVSAGIVCVRWLVFPSLIRSPRLNENDLSGLLWRLLNGICYPLPDWHLSNSFFLSFCTAICKRCKEQLVKLVKDFSMESSQENTPCLEESPADPVVSEIVSPLETQSSESSEQEMEERVNRLLKWSHFNKEF